MSEATARALTHAERSEDLLASAEKAMTGVTDWSPHGPSRRIYADRLVAEALVHATLAVAYSNMEE